MSLGAKNIDLSATGILCYRVHCFVCSADGPPSFIPINYETKEHINKKEIEINSIKRWNSAWDPKESLEIK